MRTLNFFLFIEIPKLKRASSRAQTNMQMDQRIPHTKVFFFHTSSAFLNILNIMLYFRISQKIGRVNMPLLNWLKSLYFSVWSYSRVNWGKVNHEPETWWTLHDELALKLRKFRKKILIVSMLTGQYYHMLQCLTFPVNWE